LPQGAEWGPFSAAGHVSYDAWEKAVSGGAKCGVVIELIDNYGSGLAGTAAVLHRTDASFLTRETDAARFRVKINRQLDRLGRFTTLAHELGHIYCGHLGGDARDRWAGRSGKLTIGQRELEAEAVSWLVCRRLGLETRSAEYLAGYVDEDDLGRISTFGITAAAHRVEAWRQAE
jgi:antirestriction protein ArdC